MTKKTMTRINKHDISRFKYSFEDRIVFDKGLYMARPEINKMFLPTTEWVYP